MKKWNIFFVGAVLGNLTETQIRRKLYDYQTLTGVDDTIVTDLFRMVSKLQNLYSTRGPEFSETSDSKAPVNFM